MLVACNDKQDHDSSDHTHDASSDIQAIQQQVPQIQTCSRTAHALIPVVPTKTAEPPQLLGSWLPLSCKTRKVQSDHQLLQRTYRTD